MFTTDSLGVYFKLNNFAMLSDLRNKLGKYNVIIINGFDGQNYENKTPHVMYLNYPSGCMLWSIRSPFSRVKRIGSL